MTNDEKERLRTEVMVWANSFRCHMDDEDDVGFDLVEKDKQAILDLIDRVPSEEDMRSIKAALDQIYGAFSYDAPGFHAIRKALNIEEKE